MKKIDVSGWKEFKISELFITEKSGSSIQVPTGAMISKIDLEDGNTPRITVSNFKIISGNSRLFNLRDENADIHTNK